MFFKIFILKMLCLIFQETFLPVNIELILLSTVKITLDVNDYVTCTCRTGAAEFSAYKTQLLVSDYGLNLIEVVFICQVSYL